MTNSLIQEGLSSLAKRRHHSPTLVVLGPPGSGKSKYLKQLSEALATLPAVFCLSLDFGQIRIGSKAELYDNLIDHLLDAIPLQLKLPTRQDYADRKLVFRSVIQELLRVSQEQKQEQLILLMDHLDRIPRFFAHSLARLFREMTDGNTQAEFKGLGLVAAGAISLYEQLSKRDSAFHFSKVISFPSPDKTVHLSFVRENTKLSHLPDDLLEVLAAATGGEPCFLDAVIEHLLEKHKQVPPKPRLVKNIIGSLSTGTFQLREFRQLALSFWGDQDLREIVTQLHKNEPVRLRSHGVDIDRFQLAGAVVIDRQASPPRYRFRNGMVEQFLRQLSDEFVRLKNGQPHSVKLLEELRQLNHLTEQCQQATSIWHSVEHLLEAWKILVSPTLPELHLYFGAPRAADGWWLDLPARNHAAPEKIRAVTRNAVQGFVHSTVSEIRAQQPYWACDEEQVAIAIPLHTHELNVILAATLGRTEIDGEFIESSLRHWLEMVRRLQRGITVQCIAEIAQWMTRIITPLMSLAAAPPQALQHRKQERVWRLYWRRGVALLDNNLGEVKDFVFDPDDLAINSINVQTQKLVHAYTERQEFRGNVVSVADYFAKTFPKVAEALHAHYDHLHIVSKIDGLKLPFELLPQKKSYLALEAAVSRQISDYGCAPEAALSFAALLNELGDDKTLRVLLIGADNGDLTAVRDEIEKIKEIIEVGCRARRLKPPQVKPIYPEEVDWQTVQEQMNQSWHFVHFCGHGIAPTAGTEKSGLVLRHQPSHEPGTVSCDQLREWLAKKGTWLVYLNACHTGAVSGYTADHTQNYLSLIEPVIAAGVPNVVGFRWAVFDRSAKALAIEFYRALFAVPGDCSPAQAMCIARKKVATQNEHNDAWAPAILVTQHL